MVKFTKNWALKIGPNGTLYVQSLRDRSFAMSVNAFLNPSQLNGIPSEEKGALRKAFAKAEG